MFVVSLKGQVCLITGATRGIGKAVALTMAKADLMGLVIVDIQKDAVAEETQKELQSMGVDVKFVTGDASSEDVIKEAVKVCVDNWGKIDILANIAGVSYMRGLEDTTVEQWDKVMAINLRSTFFTMKYCSEVMKKQGYGSIVNTSSIAGITGGNTGPDYGASKAGIIALTKFAAKKLGQYNIRVNAIAPGTIATDMIRRNYSTLTPEQYEKKMTAIPMKRMGEPEEVGKAVLFLASDMGSYISGEILDVTGARMS